MKYCEFCGKELTDHEQCTCSESQEKRSKAAKKWKILMYIGVPVALVLLVVVILLCSIKTDPFEFVAVTFSGYNTNGAVVLDFDRTALISELIGDEPSETDMDAWFAWGAQYDIHSNNIKVEYSPETGLSNGDEVTVSITVTGETAKEIESGTKTYTVSGLTEIELVDVFAEVDFEYKGMDGEGLLSVVPKDTADEFIKALDFFVEGDIQNGCLSNNTSITVAVSCDDSTIEAYGKAPKEKTTTVTVTGLGAHATAETLSKEDVFEIANRFVSETQSEIEKDEAFTYSDVGLRGIYFAEPKEDSLIYTINELHILIGYTRYMDGAFHSTVCFPLIFEDLVVNENGVVEIDYEAGNGTGSFYEDAEEYVNELSKERVVTEIK